MYVLLPPLILILILLLLFGLKVALRVVYLRIGLAVGTLAVLIFFLLDCCVLASTQ